MWLDQFEFYHIHSYRKILFSSICVNLAKFPLSIIG